MILIELKNKLISKINLINDDEILNEVYKLLNDSFKDKDIFHLSENHKSTIEIAKAPIAKGEYLTNKLANKEIGKLLYF